jgi:uncharacterized protein YndB with AHSA1/START domain
MSPLTPTGEVVATPSGVDLVLTRVYRAPIADVWASLTEPERTARWFGPWRGRPGAGRTIQVRMAFEEGEPWSDVLIESCTPPTHLAVVFTDPQPDGDGGSRLELRLSEVDGATTLRFTDHRGTTEALGDYGCGWEWYLDGLTAHREGHAWPAFDAYYPALKGPYDAMVDRLVTEGPSTR